MSDPTLSNRAIDRLVRITHNSVRNIRDRLLMSGECWENLKVLTNDALDAHLGLYRSAPKGRKTKPIGQKRHDLTLELLWQEYRLGEPDGLSYPQYTRIYREWVKRQKLSMRRVHVPSDKCFVDFCDRTMPSWIGFSTRPTRSP